MPARMKCLGGLAIGGIAGAAVTLMLLSGGVPRVNADCTDVRCSDPPCCNGDVNGDGAIDIGDAINLLSYLFAEGPEPAAVTCGNYLTWPNPDFVTIQSLIDAAPDGATIHIVEGTYELPEPIVVRGDRHIIMTGAGSGRDGAGPVTHLAGRAPAPVVDREGNVILLAERAQGLVNSLGARLIVQDMRLTGFDAGVVIKDDETGTRGSALLRNLDISGTGRGVLSLSAGGLTIAECTISDTLWNGISVAPQAAAAAPEGLTTINALTLLDPEGAGLYFSETVGVVEDVAITGAVGGGIVADRSLMFVSHCALLNNFKAGILLYDSKAPILSDLLISNTSSVGGLLGDGITMWLSGGPLLRSAIEHSDRVGLSLFGSTAYMQQSTIVCAPIDIALNSFGDVESSCTDGGENYCGCEGPLGACAAVPGEIEPPAPVGGLE